MNDKKLMQTVDLKNHAPMPPIKDPPSPNSPGVPIREPKPIDPNSPPVGPIPTQPPPGQPIPDSVPLDPV